MISRFRELYDTTPFSDDISWPDLFAEFSQKVPFRGDLHHAGWSPAEFEPQKRALENVRLIHALCLDYDNKTKSGDRVDKPVSLEAVAEIFGDFYALIHTTRHHTEEWPRFRVILPFTRPVNKMEYTVIWQTAARLWPGLDPAPKDPSRFWYVPGAKEDSTFHAATIPGGWLDPDRFVESKALLAPPTAPVEGTNIEIRARAYMEKMPASISGAGGHDALWKATRKLICDFGLDEHAAFRILSTEFNPRCQPPWSEAQLRHKIEDALAKAKVRNPIVDRPMPDGMLYPPIPVDAKPVPHGDAWMKSLFNNANGKPTKDTGNVTLILKNAPGFRGSLMFDLMSYRAFWATEPDFEVGIEPPKRGTPFEDHHVVYVQHVLAKRYGLTGVGKDMAWSAIEAAARENEIHPVRDYLKQQTWDGVQRLGKWLHTYLGCADTEYNAAVGRWWLISAVARAMRPGCQVDHCLILEGEQGKGKSQAVKALGEQWYLGGLPDIRDRDRAADTIGGYWIVEIAELDALKGANMTRVKEFVSQQNDVYRKAYGRSTQSRPRSCVFVATTNEKMYLNDPTGARRFWPVEVIGEVRRDLIISDRDQLWAEAKAAYEAGEQWHPERKYIEVIKEEQSARYMEDDWTGIVKRWIKFNSGGADGFCCDEILENAIGIEPRFWDRSAQMRVGNILTKSGYVRRRVQIEGEREYRYFPQKEVVNG